MANIASIDKIEHLLALMESLVDPAFIDIGDKPRTWKEAMELLYSKEWEIGYHNELKSLKAMGVYKLIPHDQVPMGHKV